MKNKVFKSKLSMKEIEENFKDVDFFSELHEGLSDAVSISAKAKRPTMIHKRSLPVVNVAKIRKSLDMTQHSFATTLGVSPRTVESWEIGKTTPTPTAKKLLHLIESDPSLVDRLK